MADIYLAISETPTVVTLTSAVINSAAASSVTVTNTVTVALDANSLSALENVTVTVGAAITGTVTVGNFPATQAVSLASVPTHAVTLTSTTVTISSLPAISGTVTANVVGFNPTPLETFGTGVIQIIADAEKDTIRSSLWIANSSANNGSAVDGQILSQNYPMPISGTVTIGSALPAGTNRIGVVTIGAGTVTIGAGTAQIGSVTASLQFTTTAGQIGQDGLTKILQQDTCPGLYQNDIQPYGVPIAFIDPSSQGQPTFRVVGNNGNSLPVTITTGNSRIGVVTIGGGTVTIGAGTAQIGSVTASLAISSTAITSGSFTSLTSATLVPGNVARKMATVYNLGAGQLFVNAGATATTLGGGFMVALSSGDFYECSYTTTTLSAIFATAGTASWVSH